MFKQVSCVLKFSITGQSTLGVEDSWFFVGFCRAKIFDWLSIDTSVLNVLLNWWELFSLFELGMLYFGVREIAINTPDSVHRYGISL